MRPGTEILAEHYQKTYELTLSLWEQRNRTFLILLFVVGAGALLTFNVSQAQPLLVDLVSSLFHIEDAGRKAELRSSFLYNLIQTLLLMVVLYLMVQLYHRTVIITRNYDYLSRMEDEIRDGLGLDRSKVSFTREGTFYWKCSAPFTRQIGVAYIVMLFLLLSAFLGMRLVIDLQAGNKWVLCADLVLILATLIFFLAYAHASSRVVRSAAGRIRSVFRGKSQSA